jgi:alkanesulfonate monooxygenase SsuD/methylene tetrahydromethanopterin reductase-like flavin-dependent oxidoreductase (luciferase family)
MRIGVVFPQTELGGDASAVRAYGQRVEELGFTHLLAYDHVVGADPAVHVGWAGPYDVHTTFHEPLVMFGYLAAVTSTLELVTGVIILPQRQMVLVAKQAAQVEVMRRLWTEQSVTFDGKHHRVTGAGLAPLPVQRPIPVWFGAASRPALERAGRLADGWFPMMSPGPQLDEARDIVARSAIAAGRDPAAIGMEGRVTWLGDPRQVADELAQWTAAGATHVSVNTMGAGLRTVDEHLAALAAVAENLPVYHPQ